MTKEELKQIILQEKVIAISRGLTLEQTVKAAKALYEGGIRCMEVTFDASGKTPDEETGKMIAAIKTELGGKMLVGAGTVMSLRQVEIASENGGMFIISPDTNEAVIKRTAELGMVSIPGAMTPTEIVTAHNFGADFVKIFPAGNLGAAYIKAIRSPLNNIPLMAVGGISDSNVAEFLAAGCAGAGIGGNLVSKKLVEAGDYAALTETAKKTVAAVK